MRNDINVEIGDLQTAIATIKHEIEVICGSDDVESEDLGNGGLLGDANKAGAEAIAALGGESTRSGEAVSSKMVSINEQEFKKTAKSVINFLESISNVHKTYQDAENAFVDSINKLGTKEEQ